jgi:hypothetical protein
VRFEIGEVTLAPEDEIVIEQVRGTSERFDVGGVYRVKGLAG